MHKYLAENLRMGNTTACFAVQGVPGKIHILVPLPSRDIHVARPLSLAHLRWLLLPCFANIRLHIHASITRKFGLFQGELSRINI